MRLRPEEPNAGPWSAVLLVDFLRLLLSAAPAAGEKFILAVDGRGASGKTTLAHRLAQVATAAEVVHTDDIAWWHSRFGWADLLVHGVIAPFRAGLPVAFRPPPWDERGRPGAVTVSDATSLLIVEGVGSSRSQLGPWVDASIWVQADEGAIAERSDARIAAGETTVSGAAGWMSEEVPFLAHDRPWQRATAIVAGTAEVPSRDTTHVLLAEWHSENAVSKLIQHTR